MAKILNADTLGARRQRLGQLMIEARRARNISKNRAWQLADISRGAYNRVENAEGQANDTTYWAIEALFEWEPGSISRYLEHDGPEPTSRSKTTVLRDDDRQRDLIDTARRFHGDEADRARVILDAYWHTLHSSNGSDD